MSDYMNDLGMTLGITAATQKEATQSTNKKAGMDLEMEDFLSLMCAMFENQTIDDTASTSEMMNQFVQMSVVTAVSNLTELLNQSTALNYASSLVGKEVTVGQWVNGELKEMLGTVTGTGTLNGQQIVFVQAEGSENSESYYLTDIMAVGRLPEKVEDPGMKQENTGAGDAVQDANTDNTADNETDANTGTDTPVDNPNDEI